MDERSCDVAVVGCGPTGAVLANLLGALGLRVEVLERDVDPFAVGRATHMDEETLRNLHATGLLGELIAHTAPFGAVDVVDEDGAVLLAEEIRARANPHGREGSVFFDQPAFERVLRAGLRRYPSVALRLGATVESLAADGDGVTLRGVSGEHRAPWSLRAAWVVGCDGGRSVVRESMGVAMRALAPERRWLIVDTALRDPADAERLPKNFRYVLDPARLTIYAHGIGINRRWEFQLGADEAAPDAATLRAWLSRYVDAERLDFLRVVAYAHRSLVAERWRAGRVLLAGDAAHMMPPSAGQGLCSGVRDALNLAWRLGRVLRGDATPTLLDGYERERAWHVGEVLAGTLFIGDRLEARTALQRWRRRSELRLIARLPRAIHELVRQHALRRPVITDGSFDGDAPLRGRHLPRAVLPNGGDIDERCGYAFALVARDEALASVDLAPARARGLGVLRLDADLDGAATPLGAWMTRHRADYALVRPDRLIFSAGPAASLPRALAAFARV